MPENQRQFSAALLDPSSPVPDGMVRPDGMPARRRFDVYRNNVVKSLVDVMSEGFPVTLSLVGETFFRAMARTYVRAHPPRSPCIIHYGETFPAFLETFGPVGHLAYLPDVARLEHARCMSCHAADDVCADILDLRGLDTAVLVDARMALRASCRVVRSEHPIWSIWRYNATDDRSAIESRGEDVLVSRPDDRVLVRRLPPGGAEFLMSLRCGQSLGQAAELAAADAPEFNLAVFIGTIFDARVIKTIFT